MSSYPTNLTDKQWQVIKNIVETKERKRKTFFTGDDKCDDVYNEDRLSMANASKRIWPLANSLLLFP